MATKSTAVAVAKKATLPANLNEQFAAEVAELQKRIAAPSGDRISITQSRTFKLPNGLEVEELEGVIVDFVAANFYYDRPFDRNNIVPPQCFAIGLEPAGLVPSGNSPDQQCASCAGCWANQFKSAANGRGKACSNTRIIALLPLDADEDTPFQIMRVPSTALKSFDGHVATVAQKFGVPVRAVSTKIVMSDDEYASPRFSVIERLNPKNPLLALAQAARESAMQRLLTEPDVTAVAAANDSKPAARGPARKTAAAGRR